MLAVPTIVGSLDTGVGCVEGAEEGFEGLGELLKDSTCGTKIVIPPDTVLAMNDGACLV